MTNEELKNKFISLDLQIGGQHDGYLTMQESDAKECAKIAIDFAIDNLKDTEKALIYLGCSKEIKLYITTKINELQNQKEEL